MRQEAYISLMDILPRRCFRTRAAITMMTTAMATIQITATTPPIIPAVLSVVLVNWCIVVLGSSVVLELLLGGIVAGVLVTVSEGDGWEVEEHSLSLSEEMATEHCGLTVSSIPLTLKPGSLLTQSSSREMRALLAV